jgi:hypothetical protein
LDRRARHFIENHLPDSHGSACRNPSAWLRVGADCRTYRFNDTFGRIFVGIFADYLATAEGHAGVKGVITENSHCRVNPLIHRQRQDKTILAIANQVPRSAGNIGDQHRHTGCTRLVGNDAPRLPLCREKKYPRRSIPDRQLVLQGETGEKSLDLRLYRSGSRSYPGLQLPGAGKYNGYPASKATRRSLRHAQRKNRIFQRNQPPGENEIEFFSTVGVEKKLALFAHKCDLKILSEVKP